MLIAPMRYHRLGAVSPDDNITGFISTTFTWNSVFNGTSDSDFVYVVVEIPQDEYSVSTVDLRLDKITQKSFTLKVGPNSVEDAGWGDNRPNLDLVRQYGKTFTYKVGDTVYIFKARAAGLAHASER